MGIFDRLFGKKPREPKAGSKKAKERLRQALDQRMGVKGKAKLSSSGHPICPNCGQEFPIPAETMQSQSAGIPIFACRSCGVIIRL